MIRTTLTALDLARMIAEGIGWMSIAMSAAVAVWAFGMNAYERIKRIAEMAKDRCRRLDGDRIASLMALVSSLGLSACAVKYKDPCEFWVKVRMMNQPAANAECKTYPGLRNDWGNPIPEDREVYGCAGQTFMISRYGGMTRLHELDHVIDKNCAE